MFYKNVKAYQTNDRPKQFDVKDLFEGCSESKVSEALAEHFNQISSEFEGLQGPPPSTYDHPLPVLTRAQVEHKLGTFKKPKSMVKGDIFPSLVTDAAPYLSMPLVAIFNAISQSGQWPDDWKVEQVTAIP